MATLGEYMRWLSENGGTCRSGIGADHVIGMVPVIKLIGPSGRSVIWNGADQSEELLPSTIEYFDRRLRMLSPFRSVERG